MPFDAIIQLSSLRVCQHCRVRLQAFPQRIQQFRFLGSGQVINLMSQIAHLSITVARFLGSCKPLGEKEGMSLMSSVRG
jgi:hypothetical protein